MKKQVLVPPDGGYGWVIVCASAASAFINIPILQNFGLIFKDRFHDIGLTAAQGTFIINCNAAFGMLTGFFNSALLKHYGYRKMSFASALLVMMGITMTSFAQTFSEYLISYGIITSYGIMLGLSSYSLAVNTYFKNRKGKAVSIGTTLSGFGPILMPQLVAYLMSVHAVQGVTLILAGVVSHSFIFALLLHPVKWHMKEEILDMNGTTPGQKLQRLDEEEEGEDVEESLVRKKPRIGRSLSLNEDVELRKKRESELTNAINEYDIESAAMYGMDSALGGSMLSLENFGVGNRTSQLRISQLPTRLGTPFKTKWWSSSTISSLGSYTPNMFDENKRRTLSEAPERTRRISRKDTFTEMINIIEEDENSSAVAESESCLKKYAKRFAEIYDLRLLKDPIYVNILLGMSLALFAEINFSTLIAFILNDFGLSTGQIGTFMSTMGTTDIIFRFLSPYITDLVRSPPRKTFIVALMVLIIGRHALTLTRDYRLILFIAAAMGIAKGIRTVSMSLVVPTYVPLEKLASASGLQSMINGILVITGGPFLGFVKDITGSYSMCIIIMNFVSLCTIIMWATEMILTSCKKSPVNR